MDAITPCNKKRHNSRSEAIFFQKRFIAGFFRTYLCPHCDFWHVSTMPLNIGAHLEILDAIKKELPTVRKIGLTDPVIALYEVEYRDSKYLVLYYINERTIRIVEETF